MISEESDPRLKERLIFVKILYDGERVKVAASNVVRSKPTGCDWLHRWNENGVDGLKPDFDGGRPSRVSEKDNGLLVVEGNTHIVFRRYGNTGR